MTYRKQILCAFTVPLLALALLLMLTGCTVNIYWTDSVVYGELHAAPKVDSDPVVVPNPFLMPAPKPDRSGTL